MPHKRTEGKIQVYSEVGVLIHQHLKRLKKEYHLPLYRIIELAIIFALGDVKFAPYIKHITTVKLDKVRNWREVE